MFVMYSFGLPVQAEKNPMIRQKERILKTLISFRRYFSAKLVLSFVKMKKYLAQVKKHRIFAKSF